MNKINKADDTVLKEALKDVFIGKKNNYYIIHPNNKLIELAQSIENIIVKKDKTYRKGKGSIEGWISELCVGKFLDYIGHDWTWTGAEEKNAIDYYIRNTYTEECYSLNVKNKIRSSGVRDYYNVVLPSKLNHDTIEFDMVLFSMSCQRDGTVFILGWYEKEKFFKDAESKKKGETIPYNLVLDEDCHVMEIKDINRIFF